MRVYGDPEKGPTAQLTRTLGTLEHLTTRLDSTLATPALARFHGAAQHAHVAAFADLDRATLALMRARALVRLAERVPRVTAEPGGELGTLLREIRKQRGHRPVRRLLRDIPSVLPRPSVLDSG